MRILLMIIITLLYLNPLSAGNKLGNWLFKADKGNKTLYLFGTVHVPESRIKNKIPKEVLNLLKILIYSWEKDHLLKVKMQVF